MELTTVGLYKLNSWSWKKAGKKRSVSRWACKNKSLTNSLCNLPDVLAIVAIIDTVLGPDVLVIEAIIDTVFAYPKPRPRKVKLPTWFDEFKESSDQWHSCWKQARTIVVKSSGSSGWEQWWEQCDVTVGTESDWYTENLELFHRLMKNLKESRKITQLHTRKSEAFSFFSPFLLVHNFNVWFSQSAGQ